ncbi:MAG: ABC transporter ATP-binding protein [Alphaproteobacteria bacterium]|nr:ABC transporter ATP-binding protein [Alphaproteobacteria bacterium]
MNPAPILSVRGVGKSFGARRVAEDIGFEAGAGEVVCLLGHSGSGKSTMLRIVAGIERADEGDVSIAGQRVEGAGIFVPPEKRRVGLVFQDLALFPHLDARANAAFGLFRSARREALRRADTLLEMVGLAAHRTSYPHQLSGGEQQRLAVARALAPRPQVMLLDEPFSGLDDRLRDKVRHEVLSVLRSEGTATLFVTHDPDEALRSADRIVLMREGRIAQAGTPDALWQNPADLDVAGFFSPVSKLPGVVQSGKIVTPLGTRPAPGLAEGTPAVIAIRPRDIALSDAGMALTPRSVSLASDGLHVAFAPADGVPHGVFAVFDPNTHIRIGCTERIALRPGHGFVFAERAP